MSGDGRPSLAIRAFEERDQAAVVSLWGSADLTRPWNDPSRDIARKLVEQRDLFLVGTVDQRVVATVMAGYEGHRGWLNYLAVAPEVRGNGYGAAIVRAAERLLLARGCPKINLQIRSSNGEVLAFYAALGYSVDDVVSMGKRLIEDG